VRRLLPELCGKKGWLLHHKAPSHTSFFTRDFFYQKQHDCDPPPILLSSLSLTEEKMKGSHFDITEVVETESQAVLNSLMEHDFQDAFKVEEALETLNTSGRGLL
jgi:hypothetical protein